MSCMFSVLYFITFNAFLFKFDRFPYKSCDRSDSAVRHVFDLCAQDFAAKLEARYCVSGLYL